MIGNQYLRPFVLLEGTPTLCLVFGDSELLLPYHSFVSGLLDKRGIQLDFGDFKALIEGEVMDELWEALQLQDVRKVFESGTGRKEGGECMVRRISVQQAAKADSG